MTIKEIAKLAGVRESTVSRVLNNKPNPIKISEKTKTRIFKIAKELGYQPNAAARALVTKKTGHIGFILSDNVTDGFVNTFFAQALAGVEKACRKRGYGLNISLYNLSNIDSFVFPKKVSQRSIDGLVLIGYVSSAVVHRFREFGIPCIAINQNLEVAELVPTVACDVVKGRFQAIKYAAELGHKYFLYDAGKHPYLKEVAHDIIKLAASDPITKHCHIEILDIPSKRSDYSTAKPMMEYWLSIPLNKRPTVIMATDQTLLAFLREMDKYNLKCPDDISLISNCDTRLCEFARPALTAIDMKLEFLGWQAANILIDCLEKNENLTLKHSKNDIPCELIIRESCSSPRL